MENLLESRCHNGYKDVMVYQTTKRLAPKHIGEERAD